MSLFEKLQHATSEEDVKDAYIKALGLKEYQQKFVDIQTKEIWFEAKDNGKHSSLCHVYATDALCARCIEQRRLCTALFCVIDTQKAAIMKSADVIALFGKKNH
jgi:recombinational DNA repair protein RecR